MKYDKNRFKSKGKEIEQLLLEIDKKIEEEDKQFKEREIKREVKLNSIRHSAGIKAPLYIFTENIVETNTLDIDNDEEDNVQNDLLSCADIIISILAGLAGVVTSWGLRHEEFGAKKKDGSLVGNGGILADIHDGNYRKTLNPILHKIQEMFEHPNNPFDKLEGAFHRLRYGHDILNWNQEGLDGGKLWEEMFRMYGDVSISSNVNINKIIGTVNTIGRYISLYLFDLFSKEGLPLPLSSLFNRIITDELGEKKYKNLLENLVNNDQSLYATFLTIKARDVIGTNLTCLILKEYRKLQTKAGKNIRKDQKYYTMNCIAHLVVLMGTLGITFKDVKVASLNYLSLGLLIKNVYQLNKRINADEIKVFNEYKQLLEESRKLIDLGESVSDILEQEYLNA